MRYSKKRYVGIIALVIVLGFIFVNSMFDWNTSEFLSKLPEELAYSLVSYGKYKWLDNFVIHQIRSFAHVFEFFIFGIFLTKFYYLKSVNVQRLANTFFAFLGVALLDETIQMFSNRHARVSDIWLDLFGALAGFLVYILYCFIKKLIKRKKYSRS